jgi:all-trans-retinol dehydrogenase (NAD+)
MVDIAGSIVLITGGASGIGRLTAQRMARQGATVVVWDLDEGTAKETVDELVADTGRAHHAYRCDVSDRDGVYELADRVRSEVGHVDIVVNNAGIVSGQLLLDLPDAKIEATFKVNVLALYWVTKAFLPEMVKRDRGHIVTIASAGGLIGVARQTDYSASKHAAIGFDESLRMELRQIAPGVRTTVICPYYVNTGMFEGVQTRFPFLLPILEQDDVADKIVDAVRRNRRRVVMPWFAKAVPLMRAVPVPAFDKIADFFGINVSMSEFVGRVKAEQAIEERERSTG